MNWEQFLSNHVARDYTYQEMDYQEQLDTIQEWIKDADAILIGAGSGLSTAAGLRYDGKRFTDNFQDFIDQYDPKYMTDMYAAGFYPYKTEEEKWAFWCRDAIINIENDPLLLYNQVYNLVKDKPHFVLTTNVDEQFPKVGFKDEDIFATQGSYALIQCAKACHDQTYNATKLFHQMIQATKDCKVPTYMVPKCPVCGGNMAMNLRADQYFVEDEHWHQQLKAYSQFLDQYRNKKLVLLELGVGFNTPIIIRFPFEDMIRASKKTKLIRLNYNQAFVIESNIKQCIGINKDIKEVMEDLTC